MRVERPLLILHPNEAQLVVCSPGFIALFTYLFFFQGNMSAKLQYVLSLYKICEQ